MIDLTISGLLLGGLYVAVSVGLSLIFGAMRIVNFAHGEFIMLGMYAVYWAYTLTGVDPYLAGLIMLPIVFALCVTLLRPFVLWLVRSASLVQVFATLGLSIALQNAALVLWTGNFRSIRTSYSQMLVHVAGFEIPFTRLVAFVVAMLAAGGLHLFLTRTMFGAAIRATAQNARTARLMGVNVDRVYAVVFALGLTSAFLAGVLLMPIYSVHPGIGFQQSLIAFVVVVLGGLGSLPGVVVGGLAIGLIEVFSGYLISPSMKQVVYFGVFLLVLMIRPAGLLGQRGSEELGMKS